MLIPPMSYINFVTLTFPYVLAFLFPSFILFLILGSQEGSVVCRKVPQTTTTCVSSSTSGLKVPIYWQSTLLDVNGLSASADKKQYLSMLYPCFAEVIAMNFAHSIELCFFDVSICIRLLCWMFFSCCFPGYGQRAFPSASHSAPTQFPFLRFSQTCSVSGH